MARACHKWRGCGGHLATLGPIVLLMHDASALHRWLHFEPGSDTVLAFASVLLMWAVFWTNAHYGTENPLILVLVFMLFCVNYRNA